MGEYVDGRRRGAKVVQHDIQEQQRRIKSVMPDCTRYFIGDFTGCSLPNICDIIHKKRITAVINHTCTVCERKRVFGTVIVTPKVNGAK